MKNNTTFLFVGVKTDWSSIAGGSSDRSLTVCDPSSSFCLSF